MTASINHVVISRTDSIGDVILTLPMCGLIKQHYPNSKITFIGRSYTQPVVELSQFVDGFVNMDELEKLNTEKQVEKLKLLNADWFIHVFPNQLLAKLAKKAGIANRVGTSHRTFHWFSCNYRLNFSRKNSNLHEAQLNCKLLSPMGVSIPNIGKIPEFYGLKVETPVSSKVSALIDPNKKNIILHPKSKGSAREWGLENFGKLIDMLPANKFKIFISGTSSEAEQMHNFLEKYKNKVVNLTGQFTLSEFIEFISTANALVAASTGPLHIASALGKTALGIYPPIRPMHPGRWSPIGNKAEALVKPVNCNDCRKTKDCHCIREITPQSVLLLLEK